MKLTIDNLDNRGPRDYTLWLDGTQQPRLLRRLNRPAELRLSLVANSPDFVVPVDGARILLGRLNGQDVFTGYVVETPKYEYLGWSGVGPVYRYRLVARSDEVLLDRKTIRRRLPFVGRSAGDALRELTEGLEPGVWDTSAIAQVDTLPPFLCDPQKTWSQHAAEIALLARGAYRAQSGAIVFAPVGNAAYTLNESDANFSPGDLKLESADLRANDITVIGRMEPQSYVKDYFVGDGLTLKFYLSQMPFVKSNYTLLDEEYKTLDPAQWVTTDPSNAISVVNGTLAVNGGNHADGGTTLTYIEKLEMGGALVLQHGDVVLNAASNGVIGGLYAGAITIGGCLAGFRVTPAGAQSSIQALINGSLQGTALLTEVGHRYVLTTRLFASEVYRQQQVFHSAEHAAGDALGGGMLDASLRVVLEAHDIDQSNPGSMAAPSLMLYDGVMADAPNFCTYALVNAAALYCAVAFTRILRAVGAEVRSALPGANYRTRLAGLLAEGADCHITTEPALQFYPDGLPAANELIEVRYRGNGRALARVNDPANITALQRGNDNGVRSVVRNVKLPIPRTTSECEEAALVLLEDGTSAAWTGEYTTWSDFLPGGASDLFPGDALQVNMPSRGATVRATVREVEVVVMDLAGEHSQYTIRFANDTAQPLAIDFQTGPVSESLALIATPRSGVGATTLADLTTAEITLSSSTSVTIDTGTVPPSGGGFEVRWSDFGWGPANDRNLVGRFTTRTFVVPRLTRVQNYYLRQYDSSSPTKYSRYSAALHLDFPL